jgi:hypothetical protein
MSEKQSVSTGGGCLFVLALLAAVCIWAKWSFWAALAFLAAAFVLTVVVIAKTDAAQRAQREAEQAARLAALTARFGAEHARRIMNGEYWQGATVEMMHEAFGAPADVKQRVMKTKTRETHCYDETGKNRYALRLHFENGVLVGWDVSSRAEARCEPSVQPKPSIRLSRSRAKSSDCSAISTSP